MTDYRTIHTSTGLSAIASAEASGIPINLTHMAVGDGNGNPVSPEQTQTALVREKWRGSINRIYKGAANPSQFTAEVVVPSNAGGFVMREVGLFDSNGSLFAIGNLPDTYKPLVEEGASADAVVRMVFEVANSTIVSIAFDPNVATASQAWALNNINAAWVIPGGSTGQVLRKASNSNGDVVWVTPDVAESVVVDAVEERQTLAENQTTVALATVTTDGLAVYVDGKRKARGAGINAWLPDVADPDTTLVLGASYLAGTEILAVQNEPHGNIEFPLIQENNLGDVASIAEARQNLDVYSKAEADNLSPAGLVAFFAQSNAPTGWLKANGAAVSRTVYARLFAAIGSQYGAGDGTSTFNLPDLRGEFVRGFDDGRGIDSGRAFGSWQSDANKSHLHAASTNSAGDHSHNLNISSAGSHAHNTTCGNAGNHGHGGSIGLGGDHNHTGSSAIAGTHSHSELIPYGIYAQAGNPNGYGMTISHADVGQKGLLSTVGWVQSSGSHSHNVSIDWNGDHSHLLTVDTGGTHSHAISVATDGSHFHAGTSYNAGSHTHAIFVSNDGAPEARPRNVALLACIRY